MTTASRVTKVLADMAGKHVDTVKPESTLRDDLDLDSLDIFEVLVDLEDEFDILINESEGVDCKTVVDVIAFVERTALAQA